MTRAGIRSRANKALKSTAIMSLSLAAFGTQHAFAQDAEAPNVEVAANLAANVVVTGQRKKLESPKYTAPLLDTPQTISIIDGKAIAQQNLLSLQSVLSTLPGITFGAGEGGGGYGDKITLRGYDAGNDITVDGVRDSAQYSRTDPFNLEQVEVVNGANSVYSGAGAVGGSINLVTKRPRGANTTDILLGGGTDKYARATVDADRLLTDTIAVRLNAVAHQNDVPGRDVENYKRWAVAPAIALGLGTPTQFTTLYTHQQDNNIPVYGVPYALNAFNNGPLPGVDKSDYFGYRNIDKQKITADSLTLIVDHQFNEWLSVRNLTRWEQVDQLSIVDPPQGAYCLASGIDPFSGSTCSSPGTYVPSGPRGNLRDTSNEELVNQTDLRAQFETLGLEHTAVLGASFSDETYRLDTGRVLRNPLGATPDPTLPAMDLFNPDSIYTGPVNYIRSSFTDSQVRNRAVYLFDNVVIVKQLELNAGVRFESNRGKSATATIAVPYPAPPAAPSITPGLPAANNDDLLSYRAGIVYKPVPQASIYFAYGNSQTPSQSSVNGSCTLDPTTRSGSNCNLDPEKAVSYEAGVKWNLLEGQLQLTASAFRNERTNFRVNSGDPSVPEQQLDGQSRVDGIALGATGLITEKWSVIANYTYLKSKILQSISDIAVGGGALDFQSGDPLPGTPENSFTLWTTYRLPYEITAGYGVTYQGPVTYSRPSAGAPLFYTPDYWVHRLMVSYEVARGLVAQVNVGNLFDETYYTHIRNNATSGWAIPGEARSVTVSLAYRF